MTRVLANPRLIAQIQNTVWNVVDPVDVTIYNKYVSSGDEAYYRTQLEADLWSSRKAANVLAAGGNTAVDSATIIISQRDANSSYTAPVAWRALGSKTGWTLQRGDVIVKGAVTDTISSSFTITDLKAKYDEVLVISSVDWREIGGVKHWKIGAR